MRVKYCGPALDYSGYGEANRHDIGALTAAGIDVIGEYTRHCLEIAEFGELGALAQECATKVPDQYQIKILHTTPNIYGRFIEPGKYHIGRVFWETDKLPPDFARGVAMVDEIWTGSEFNAQAIRNAGINKPIYIIPEAIQTPAPSLEPFIVPNVEDFKFYSVFEWTERKNPLALLEAFWREFENTPGVSLTLKTYIDNFTPERRQAIRSKFTAFRSQLKLADTPPVYLYTNLLNRSEMYRLHATFDCYVSAHRGEGWGIPQMEALLMGNPVISTNCGGIHEWIEDGAYLIPCSMVPVSNVDRNDIWYLPDQKWAEVNITELRAAMRDVFEDRVIAFQKAAIGQRTVINRFSLPAVGEVMRDRLETITKQLTTSLQ